MAIISYHASHEQFAPSQLLKFAVMAEEAGFHSINSSDHFHPWSKRQGQSGFSFAWLGAAMAKTSLPYSMVCAPGQRYHPAIIAQALATLGEMFPGRIDVALGTGEALNECITGMGWSPKAERQKRLLESFNIIQRLLQGETVTHKGRVTIQHAKLYTLSQMSPLLLGAAVTPSTAAWVGSWADGLLTVHKPLEELRETIRAFRLAGGKDKPIHIKVQLSYARNGKEAIDGAHHQWRNNIFDSNILSTLTTVDEFDLLGSSVLPVDLHKAVNISESIEQHCTWIQQYIDLGFDKIILHNVNRNQDEFIKDFGQHGLPLLKLK